MKNGKLAAKSGSGKGGKAVKPIKIAQQPQEVDPSAPPKSHHAQLRDAAQEAIDSEEYSEDIVEILKDWLGVKPEQKVLPILTERQEEIFRFLQSGAKKHRMPTVREIGNKFGIRSPNGVMCHLKALERKGCIVREEHLSRGIQIPDHYLDAA